MAGLKELIDIYKKGEDSLNEFLCVDSDTNILVTEKLDAYRFSIEKSSDGTLQFFKRNDKTPIDKVDRLISDLYEKAITYFESMDPKTVKWIPEGLRFGFAYFPNKKPLRIEYNRVPKNNLVLTDVTQRDSKTQKVVKVFEDINLINRWAGILDVGQPPVIYNGKLKEEQLFFIKEILSGSPKLDAMFTEHITAVFGKSYTGNSIIEGVVIKTQNGLAQLKDPSFQFFEISETQKETRDFYDIIILELHNFLENKGIPKRLAKIKTDERYIECVSDIFNAFVLEGNIDPDSDPKFLTPNIIGSKGKIGYKFIQNPITRQLVQDNKLYEELFKVFLNTLRKVKRPHGLLNENIVSSLNKYVDEISNVTNINLISEYAQHDTNDETEVYLENNNINIKGHDSSEVYVEAVDVNELIENNNDAFIDTFFKRSKQQEAIDKDGVIIFIHRYNTFSNSHLEKIKSEYEKNNNKFILLSIDTSKQLDKGYKWVINSELNNKIMQAASKEYPKYIIGYYMLDYNTLFRIYDICNTMIGGVYPIKFIICNGQQDFYEKQFSFEINDMDNRLGIINNIEIEWWADEDEYKILKSIQNNKVNDFKLLVPNAVSNFWDFIARDWFTWANK